jgi:hypothetical protein
MTVTSYLSSMKKLIFRSYLCYEFLFYHLDFVSLVPNPSENRQRSDFSFFSFGAFLGPTPCSELWVLRFHRSFLEPVWSHDFSFPLDLRLLGRFRSGPLSIARENSFSLYSVSRHQECAVSSYSGLHRVLFWVRSVCAGKDFCSASFPVQAHRAVLISISFLVRSMPWATAGQLLSKSVFFLTCFGAAGRSVDWFENLGPAVNSGFCFWCCHRSFFILPLRLPPGVV